MELVVLVPEVVLKDDVVLDVVAGDVLLTAPPAADVVVGAVEDVGFGTEVVEVLLLVRLVVEIITLVDDEMNVAVDIVLVLGKLVVVC